MKPVNATFYTELEIEIGGKVKKGSRGRPATFSSAGSPDEPDELMDFKATLNGHDITEFLFEEDAEEMKDFLLNEDANDVF